MKTRILVGGLTTASALVLVAAAAYVASGQAADSGFLPASVRVNLPGGGDAERNRDAKAEDAAKNAKDDDGERESPATIDLEDPAVVDAKDGAKRAADRAGLDRTAADGTTPDVVKQDADGAVSVDADAASDSAKNVLENEGVDPHNVTSGDLSDMANNVLDSLSESSEQGDGTGQNGADADTGNQQGANQDGANQGGANQNG